MNIAQQRSVFRHAAAISAAGFAGWLLAATPSTAVNDSSQLLSGALIIDPAVSTLRYTAPGSSSHNGFNFPAAGLGEIAAGIRMQAGTVSGLKVKLVTATAPSSGAFVLTVMKNGSDTVLSCSITAAAFSGTTGICNAGTPVSFSNNQRLTVEADASALVGSGQMVVAYTMLLN